MSAWLKRCLVYLLISLIAGAGYLFVPLFNFSTQHLISNYAMFMWQGRLIDMIVNTLIFCVIVFVGLWFLFGLNSSRRHKD